MHLTVTRLIHLSCKAISTFDASLSGYGAHVSCCNEIKFFSVIWNDYERVMSSSYREYLFLPNGSRGKRMSRPII